MTGHLCPDPLGLPQAVQDQGPVDLCDVPTLLAGPSQQGHEASQGQGFPLPQPLDSTGQASKAR
jgi:hypothetical protein